MKKDIKQLINNLYNYKDEINDIIEEVTENIEELDNQIYFIDDNEYIKIDELIKLLENDNLINQELKEYLEKLQYRR